MDPPEQAEIVDVVDIMAHETWFRVLGWDYPTDNPQIRRVRLSPPDGPTDIDHDQPLAPCQLVTFSWSRGEWNDSNRGIITRVEDRVVDVHIESSESTFTWMVRHRQHQFTPVRRARGEVE